MDDIVINVVAWTMATSMVIGVVGGWLVFVVALLNDYFSTRTIRLPRWARSRQHGTRTTGTAPSQSSHAPPVLQTE